MRFGWNATCQALAHPLARDRLHPCVKQLVKASSKEAYYYSATTGTIVARYLKPGSWVKEARGAGDFACSPGNSIDKQ